MTAITAMNLPATQGGFTLSLIDSPRGGAWQSWESWKVAGGWFTALFGVVVGAVPTDVIAHEEALVFHVVEQVPCDGAKGLATGRFVVVPHKRTVLGQVP
jgi:hypothetical protein